MISQAVDQAIIAKLQRIGAVASIFEDGLERQADHMRHGGEAPDTVSQAITDFAEVLKTQIAETDPTPTKTHRL